MSPAAPNISSSSPTTGRFKIRMSGCPLTKSLHQEVAQRSHWSGWLCCQEGLRLPGPAMEEGRAHRGHPNGLRPCLQGHRPALRWTGQPANGRQQSGEIFSVNFLNTNLHIQRDYEDFFNPNHTIVLFSYLIQLLLF